LGQRRRTAHLPPVVDVVLCLAWLIALTTAAFAPHVLHGGLYSDDWSIASDVHFAKPEYFGAVREIYHIVGGRPVLAAALPVSHVLFGDAAGPQIAFGLLLGIATCLSFFVLLRMLGLERLPATLIASLALVFPWSDSVRLWITGSAITIAISIYFVGVICALSGLSRCGRKSAALHGGAVLCYVVSVLTYQATGLAAALTGAIYLAHAPRERALRRWAIDFLAVVAALGWSANATRDVRHVATPTEMFSDIPAFVRQATVLFVDALLAFPGADAHRALEAAALVVVIVVVATAAVRMRRARDASGRWLFVAAASAVVLMVAYVMLLGSFLHPLDHGLDNRANVFAAFAYAPLVYACVMVVANVVAPRAANVVGLTCICLILVGYVLRVRSDEADWADAAALQRRVLAAIERELPTLPKNASVMAVSFPGETAPEVPVFEATWDLAGALQLRAEDRTIQAFPLFDDGTITCGARTLIATAPGSFGRQEIAYTSLFVVSPYDHARIPDSEVCRRVLPDFPRGPRMVRTSAPPTKTSALGEER
jgi:hypothetical protein